MSESTDPSDSEDSMVNGSEECDEKKSASTSSQSSHSLDLDDSVIASSKSYSSEGLKTPYKTSRMHLKTSSPLSFRVPLAPKVCSLTRVRLSEAGVFCTSSCLNCGWKFVDHAKGTKPVIKEKPKKRRGKA